MSTARDLINGSLRLIGAIATGETAAAVELTDGLDVLNDMMDSWSTERLIIHSKVREEFSLVSGTGSYTIGASGTFNTTRPLAIESAMIEDQSVSPTAEYPVEIMNLDQWSRIAVKDTTATFPTRLYYDTTNPLATIYLWPKPSAANKLVIYSRKTLTRFATLSTSVALPPGYLRALRFNLAIELAPEYGKSVTAEVASTASESKANIKRMNIGPNYLESSFVGKGFDIYSGE